MNLHDWTQRVPVPDSFYCADTSNSDDETLLELVPQIHIGVALMQNHSRDKLSISVST